MNPDHSEDQDHHAMSHATQTVKDPVCGMTVNPDTAEHQTVYNGVTYAFCRQSCQERFLQTSDAYLKTAPPTDASETGLYTCPNRDWFRRGLELQPGGGLGARAVSGCLSHRRRRDARLFRSSSRDYHLSASRASAGVSSPALNQRGDPISVGIGR